MAAQPPLKPQGAIKGEEGGFKVVYLHGGQEHVVEGLASREEAELVCDALAAKELADALQGLGARRLHQKGSSLRWAAECCCHACLPSCERLFYASSASCQPAALSCEPTLPASCTSPASTSWQSSSHAAQLPCGARAPGLWPATACCIGQPTGCAAAVQAILAVSPGMAALTNQPLQAAPLHLAAIRGHEAAVRLLLAAAPELAAAQASGSTPIMLAAYRGHLSVLQVLYAARPEAASIVGSGGQHVMHYAAHAGQVDCIRLLLGVAPDMVTLEDELGRLPIHFAAKHGNVAVAKVLLEAAPGTLRAVMANGWNILHCAAFGGHAAAVREFLVLSPASAAAALASKGVSPLHIAAMEGHVPVIEALLDAAPQSALQAADHSVLPLHIAAEEGHAAAVKKLLAAAPQAASMLAATRHTPLKLALGRLGGEAAEGCMAAARLLVAAGPAHQVLKALRAAGPHAIPLFADCAIARVPLADAEWERVPVPCPGLGRALPAALSRSLGQAARLVTRLPDEDVARLHTFALCLARV